MKDSFDIVVIGAGAAGMMCAAIAAQRGATVALLDHAEKIGEKIRISGGGRCNFTNIGTTVQHFVGENPRFAKFALMEYTPKHFVELINNHGIAYHEKHRGQLFCDQSAGQIISMLKNECAKGSVHWFNPVSLDSIGKTGEIFLLSTSAGNITASKVVIATGGLSIPKIGATDLGYRIARQFGIATTDTRPSLVPLTFDAQQWESFVPLSGVGIDVSICVSSSVSSNTSSDLQNKTSAHAAKKGSPRSIFNEDLLFTHRGLSGPAILQISNYWNPGESLIMDLLPEHAIEAMLLSAKTQSHKTLGNELATVMSKQLASLWLVAKGFGEVQDKKIADVSDKTLRAIALSLKRWSIVPSGTEGYKKAEVTRGGVATNELDTRSMQSAKVSGLHFIGEVVDITGWLGGYNFQWAWASAAACARAMTP